jgi:putative DNA primase/helicase
MSDKGIFGLLDEADKAELRGTSQRPALKLVDSAEKKKKPPVPRVEVDSDQVPAFSQEALAMQFADMHSSALRYVSKQSRWLIYDGTRWLPDEKMRIFTLVRKFCRHVSAEVNDPRDAKLIAHKNTVASVEYLIRSDERLAATVHEWDTDLWLLNTPGGTVDLKTGKLRPHSADEHITKITSVTPGGECPLWLKFLDRVTPDRELQGFLQRMCGYALTGSTKEHALFFLHGDGGNGKGVFLQTVSRLTAEYHCNAPISTFTVAQGDRHPTEIADLCGARLVTVAETEQGRQWSESLIKQLTGGDPMKARFMRQDLFEFTPQLTLVISGNHKPTLNTVDMAIRRRMNLIPFTVTIGPEEKDVDLPEKLEAEWPGILQWMIDGCLDWQRQGLAAPQSVIDATNEYLANEDALATWLQDKCETKPSFKESANKLFAEWSEWCDDAGEDAGKSKHFYDKMSSKGFRKEREKSGRVFYGIRLRQVWIDD